MTKLNLLIGSKQPRVGRTAVATIAVLGTGSIGSRHLGVLAGVEGVRPMAIPLRSSRRAVLEQGGFFTCGSLQEASQEGAMHAVIASDTARHVEDTLAALRLGLDVLVEKPMALNAQDARRIEDEAVRLGRKIFVGCVLRFSESLNRFCRWLPELGKMHSVEIECRSYLPEWRPERPYRESYSARADEGGVLRDLIHEIDYAGWLFGWPQRLQATLRNLGRLGIAAEELAEVRWETPAAGMLSIHLDYLSRPSCRRLTACGERGTIAWDGIAQTVTLEMNGVPARVWRSTQTRDEMFAAQARAFISARGLSPNPRLATGDDGMRALAVCDAARRASQSRREEMVVYP